MTTNINDLQKYKRAKVVVKELKYGITLIDVAIKGFEKIKKYTAIQAVLLELKDAKAILSIHLENHQQIIKNKGEMSNEN